MEVLFDYFQDRLGLIPIVTFRTRLFETCYISDYWHCKLNPDLILHMFLSLWSAHFSPGYYLLLYLQLMHFSFPGFLYTKGQGPQCSHFESLRANNNFIHRVRKQKWAFSSSFLFFFFNLWDFIWLRLRASVTEFSNISALPNLL